MSKFKIFYSWQSDLPGNKTRNFIRDCIDEAIDLAEESEAIEAERDEATKDTTGSPNIVTTLFSKIDDTNLLTIGGHYTLTESSAFLCFYASDAQDMNTANTEMHHKSNKIFYDKKKTVGRYDCINLLFLIW